MEKFESLASKLVKNAYIKTGLENLISRENLFQLLLETKNIPLVGYNEQTVTYILDTLAAMDSNNFHSNCGVGEREGRIFSPLVSRRNFALAHGIGRSGDIIEVQPKAAGSSLMYTLTNHLVHHALKIAGLTEISKAIVVPMATGMTLALCLLTLKKNRADALYVVWPRIDQKSCFKCILTANCVPLVVENAINNDGSMSTNVSEIDRLLQLHGDKILCVLATTSCFAPRQPDNVEAIGRLCKSYNVPQIINNAYGLQCESICKSINRACRVGRVDAGTHYYLLL